MITLVEVVAKVLGKLQHSFLHCAVAQWKGRSFQGKETLPEEARVPIFLAPEVVPITDDRAGTPVLVPGAVEHRLGKREANR